MYCCMAKVFNPLFHVPFDRFILRKMLTIVTIVVLLFLQMKASSAKMITQQGDICLNSYSWSVSVIDQQFMYQYTITDSSRHCLDTCQTEGNTPSPDIEYAEQVYEVNTDFYGSTDDNGDVITCLNITFEVRRHSASNLEGLIFTLEDHWNGGYKECYRLNFTSGLNRLSVYDSTAPNKNRIFHFDCFCDLKISDDGPNEYTLKIRSLPYQSQDCTLIDDQTVTMQVRVPVCNDPVRTWTDKYCEMIPREEWTPSIDFYQAIPEYYTFRLTFTPAPASYSINLYRIYIYSLMGNIFIDGHIIYTDDMIVTPVEVNGFVVNTTSIDYEINANPGDTITVMIITGKDSQEETRTNGPNVIFRGNPCETHFCEPLGSCIPRGDDYVCHCMEGTVQVNNRTCIQNPCKVNTCGPLGSCIPSGQDYHCKCQEGSLNINNHTCIRDTCESISCEPFGSCIPLGDDYYCQCQEGTINLNNHTCIQSIGDSNTWKGITGAAVIGALLVFIFLAICICCKRIKEHQDQRSRSCSSLGSDDILFAFSEKNYKFVNLVEMLARLLRTRGDISPVLPTQNTQRMTDHEREQWLESASVKAKKIVWICSTETSEPVHSNNFEKLLKLTESERQGGKDRHLVCFFSKVCSGLNIPCKLREFRTYSLLEDLDLMWFNLQDIEKPTSLSSNNILLPGREPCTERTELICALESWSGNHHEESQDSGFPCEFVSVDGDQATGGIDLNVLISHDGESDSDNHDSAFDEYLSHHHMQYRKMHSTVIEGYSSIYC
nr:uncharacterized protein LOC129256750 isoform X1 [Lytechinus pictus]